MINLEESVVVMQPYKQNEPGGNGKRRAPDPEVIEKPVRRKYSASYKLSILKKTDSMVDGEIGSFLRQEGLYWSALTRWRRERDMGMLSGLEPRKRGRKLDPPHPWANKVIQLERENAGLKRKLEQAEKIIEVQKKLSELFGLGNNLPGGKL